MRFERHHMEYLLSRPEGLKGIKCNVFPLALFGFEQNRSNVTHVQWGVIRIPFFMIFGNVPDRSNVMPVQWGAFRNNFPQFLVYFRHEF